MPTFNDETFDDGFSVMKLSVAKLSVTKLSVMETFGEESQEKMLSLCWANSLTKFL